MKILYAILIGLILSSCNPYVYMLNKTDEFYRLEGFILSDLGSVEVISENSFELHDSAITCLRNAGLTQYQADFTMRIKNGEGIKLSMRSVEHFFPDHPSISFFLTKNGYFVEENGVRVFEDTNFKLTHNFDYKVKLRNQGDIVKFELDCDTLYYEPTNLIATEYLFFETLSGSEAKIFGVSFIETIPIDEELKEDF